MDAGLATVLLVVATTLPSPPEQSSERVAQRVKALAPRLAAGEPGVRARAEQSLLDLGPEAAGVLLEAMIVAPLDQRRAIRAILPEFGPAAVDTLYQGTERIAAGRPLEDYQAIQDEGAAIVAEMGEPAVPELYELLEEGRPSPPEGWPDPVSPSPPQVFAVLALSKMGSLGLDHLMALLKHHDRNVRVWVAGYLGNAADPYTAGALLEGLTSQDAAVRMYSARGLGTLRDPSAAEPLQSLLSDPSWGVRRAAGAALAKMYDRRFLEPLVKLARSDSELSVRETVANALIKWTGDPIAARLGRRYRPVSIMPMARQALNLASIVMLFTSSCLMYMLIWVGGRYSGGSIHLGLPLAAWASGAGIALLGFVWGRVLVGLSETTELALLLAAVPGTAWVAWWAAPGFRGLRVPTLGCVTVLALATVAPLAGVVVAIVAAWLAPRVLVGLLAVALVVAWRIGRKMDPSLLRPFRRTAMLGMVTFYAGYGVGWLALWGFFGA